jgi:hypothetical protein
MDIDMDTVQAEPSLTATSSDSGAASTSGESPSAVHPNGVSTKTKTKTMTGNDNDNDVWQCVCGGQFATAAPASAASSAGAIAHKETCKAWNVGDYVCVCGKRYANFGHVPAKNHRAKMAADDVHATFMRLVGSVFFYFFLSFCSVTLRLCDRFVAV